MSLVASMTRPVTIVTWDLDSNVPSEAFAVGCGETLGTPAGLVHDKGDRSGTEQRSTLIQRRNSSLLLTHMAIIFQCAPSCLIRSSTWQPGRQRASPLQPSVTPTLQTLKCVQYHHPYQPWYKPNCSRTASAQRQPFDPSAQPSTFTKVVQDVADCMSILSLRARHRRCTTSNLLLMAHERSTAAALLVAQETSDGDVHIPPRSAAWLGLHRGLFPEKSSWRSLHLTPVLAVVFDGKQGCRLGRNGRRSQGQSVPTLQHMDPDSSRKSTS
ncbi:hypothetical protein J1614_001614 [Plenodomus biglobosus]|nr:hypothetical protein J1614_001614 [Plenodomus biglobosus]